MRRLASFVLTLSSIPLGISLYSYTLDRREKRTDSAASQAAPSEGAPRSIASQIASEPAVQSSLEHDGAERAPRDRPAADSESYSVVQQPSPSPERAHTTVTPTAPADVIQAHAEQALDTSVVDQPFPVSASVIEACKPPYLGTIHRSDCDRIDELLMKMASEPRDEVWATSIEKVLRAYAEQEPGKFTIRAVECRKTICFIETASIFEGLPDPDFQFLRTHGFQREYAVDARETDETGNRWTVSLFPFTRK